MKKTAALILLLAMLISPSYAQSGFVFTDDTQERIELLKKPESTAVIFSSFAEMWILSGGAITVTVGETVERGLAGEDVCIVDKGAGKRIDTEKLIMSGTDFIIGSADIPAHVNAREILKQTGIPFALFHVECLEDYLRVFKIMTQINRAPDNFLLYGQNVYQVCAEILQKSESFKMKYPQKILFIRSGSSYSSAKAKTKKMHFAAQMLFELGAENIADDVPVIIDGLSFEEIYMKDPDAIFISLMGNEEAARAYMTDLFSEPGWRDLKAVKNGRCYFLPKELYQFKPNQRWAEAYREMAKMLYPEWTEE